MSAGSLLAQGRALLDARRPNDAVVVLLQACALDPTGANARCLAATAYLQLHQFQDAHAAAADALRIAPADVWAHRLRALALLRMKKARQALEAANQAIRIAPDTPEGYLVLAEVEATLRHITAARAAGQRALALAPHRSAGHVMLSMVGVRSRHWAEAETHARAALAIDPENTAALNNLALALRATGRRREAVHYLGTASSLDPRNPLYRRNALRAANSNWGVVALAIVALIYLAGGNAAGAIVWVGAAVAFRLVILAKRRQLPSIWRTPIARLRRRSPHHAPDPKASPELMTELRRQNFPAAGRAEAGIRRAAHRAARVGRRPAGDRDASGDMNPREDLPRDS